MSSEDHPNKTETAPAISETDRDTPADPNGENELTLREGDLEDRPITPSGLHDQFCVLVDTVIKPCWKENCLLREELEKFFALLQQKSELMEEMNDNYFQYHTQVKQKHKATVEMFKVQRAEKENLKKEVESLKSQLNDYSQQASVAGPAGELKTTEPQKGQRQAANQSRAERKRRNRRRSTRLQKEQEKVAELTQELEESKKREEALKACLMDQRSEVTDELDKECQTLQAHQELANSEGRNQLHKADKQLKRVLGEQELSERCKTLQEKYECTTKQVLEYQHEVATLKKELASVKESLKRREEELEDAEILSSQLLSELSKPPTETGGLQRSLHPRHSNREDPFADVTVPVFRPGELRCHLCNDIFSDPAARTLHISKHFQIGKFLTGGYDVICDRFDDFCILEP